MCVKACCLPAAACARRRKLMRIGSAGEASDLLTARHRLPKRIGDPPRPLFDCPREWRPGRVFGFWPRRLRGILAHPRRRLQLSRVPPVPFLSARPDRHRGNLTVIRRRSTTVRRQHPGRKRPPAPGGEAPRSPNEPSSQDLYCDGPRRWRAVRCVAMVPAGEGRSLRRGNHSRRRPDRPDNQRVISVRRRVFTAA